MCLVDQSRLTMHARIELTKLPGPLPFVTINGLISQSSLPLTVDNTDTQDLVFLLRRCPLVPVTLVYQSDPGGRNEGGMY